MANTCGLAPFFLQREKTGREQRQVKLCNFGQCCWRPECHFRHKDEQECVKHFSSVWSAKLSRENLSHAGTATFLTYPGDSRDGAIQSKAKKLQEASKEQSRKLENEMKSVEKRCQKLVTALEEKVCQMGDTAFTLEKLLSNRHANDTKYLEEQLAKHKLELVVDLNTKFDPMLAAFKKNDVLPFVEDAFKAGLLNFANHTGAKILKIERKMGIGTAEEKASNKEPTDAGQVDVVALLSKTVGFIEHLLGEPIGARSSDGWKAGDHVLLHGLQNERYNGEIGFVHSSASPSAFR